MNPVFRKDAVPPGQDSLMIYKTPFDAKQSDVTRTGREHSREDAADENALQNPPGWLVEIPSAIADLALQWSQNALLRCR